MQIRRKQLIVIGLGLIVVVLVLGGVVWHALRKRTALAAVKPGQPILQVGRHVVGSAEFREAQNRFFKRWRRNSYMLRLSDEERNDRLVEELINQIAIAEYLKQRVKVDAAAVADYLNRYVKTKYSNEAELAQYLDGIGTSQENLTGMITLYLAKMRYFPQLARQSGITVTTDQVDREFQRQKKANRKAIVQHILITAKERTPQAAEQLARQLYRQLLQGASFAKLARQYSDDALTSGNSGIMEPVTPETMAAQLRDKVFTAEPGQLLPALKTRQGWEIIKLRRIIIYYHPRAEIAASLLMEKFVASAQFQNWLKEIKAAMKIVILHPGLQAYRCYREEKYQKAAALYERVYRDYRRESDLRRALECNYLTREWDRVIRLGKLGSRQFQDKVPYYLAGAEGYYHRKRFRKALGLLKKAEAQAGDNRALQQMVAAAYTRMKLLKSRSD
jgi:parvulin-like peptidyl-prolyl isomerase